MMKQSLTLGPPVAVSCRCSTSSKFSPVGTGPETLEKTFVIYKNHFTLDITNSVDRKQGFCMHSPCTNLDQMLEAFEALLSPRFSHLQL